MAGIRREWLRRVGDVEVDRITDVKRSMVPCNMSVPAKGVLHTTEGDRLGSISVFRNVTGTPTLGCGRAGDGELHVDQFMPIGEMALTLENDAGGTETNAEARVQIEAYAFSRQTTRPKWFLGVDHKEQDEAEKNLLADLVWQCSEAAGIPHRHAGAGFLNRSTNRWDTAAGWYGHSEVPENAHWDPGTFDWDELFKRGQRWQFRLVNKDGVVAKSETVRGHVAGAAYAKFISKNALRFARQSMTAKRPRFIRHRVR